MTPYGFPPRYNPMGYTPNHAGPVGHSQGSPPSQATAGQRLQAIRAKASHIASDGAFCYRWRYGRVEQAEWYTDHYGSYWQIGELMPPGVVKVE